MRAECLVWLGRIEEAQQVANEIVHLDNLNADAVFVRGLCLYYRDRTDNAFAHFQQVLRLAPDHRRAKEFFKTAKLLIQTKQEGNDAFKAGRLQEAFDKYSNALELDSRNNLTNAKLHCNRATVLAKLNKTADSLAECTKAIELDPSYVKAYLRRAKCHTDLEHYEEAVYDYEKVSSLDKSNQEYKQLLSDAKMALKKSKRKNYYKILGVEKSANDDEIKKAYKKRALIHHPDRHANASESERAEQEKKFKDVGEAYTVLSDKKKRAQYDSGRDLEDMGGYSGDAMDPNTIFQTFFSGHSTAGGGGGFGFPGMSTAGGSGAGGGFPGGFSFHFGQM